VFTAYSVNPDAVIVVVLAILRCGVAERAVTVTLTVPVK
jgi:hypothetical protein